MDNSETVYLKIKEGEVKGYFDALLESFGGEVSGNVYEVNRGRTRIRLTSYAIIPGFEISTASATHYTPVVVDRESDDNPELIHINVIKEGAMTRDYDINEKRTEADTSKGIFINNGLFPMIVTHPPNALLQSISFKISKDALRELIPEALDTFETLFESNEPVAYHTHLPVELEALVEDIFVFKKSEFGSKPLVVARSLELFTLLLRSVRKLVDKDELHGLHIDDYQRLLKLKDQLLSSFDQRISVEGLASEFGISVSKLKRDFKALFNTSVYQFYTHARMDEAYRRLQSGKYSVMEVGYDLGYQNLSKFSSMFKKVKGINPKDVMPV